jgi:hypothetical protein
VDRIDVATDRVARTYRVTGLGGYLAPAPGALWLADDDVYDNTGRIDEIDPLDGHVAGRIPVRNALPGAVAVTDDAAWVGVEG